MSLSCTLYGQTHLTSSLLFIIFFSPALCTGTRLPPHAEPHEMNKAPQPITGSPSNPHPAPSPGLSQVSDAVTSLSAPPS